MPDEETAQHAAQEAIFKAAKELAEHSRGLGGITRSTMLRDAAFAYRLAAGGPQPGISTTSEK